MKERDDITLFSDSLLSWRMSLVEIVSPLRDFHRLERERERERPPTLHTTVTPVPVSLLPPPSTLHHHTSLFLTSKVSTYSSTSYDWLDMCPDGVPRSCLSIS